MSVVLPLQDKITIETLPKAEVKGISIKLGLGRFQTSPLGLTAVIKSYTIQWRNLSLAEKDYLVSFFKELGTNYMKILYTPPYSLEGIFTPNSSFSWRQVSQTKAEASIELIEAYKYPTLTY